MCSLATLRPAPSSFQLKQWRGFIIKTTHGSITLRAPHTHQKPVFASQKGRRYLQRFRLLASAFVFGVMVLGAWARLGAVRRSRVPVPAVLGRRGPQAGASLRHSVPRGRRARAHVRRRALLAITSRQVSLRALCPGRCRARPAPREAAQAYAQTWGVARWLGVTWQVAAPVARMLSSSRPTAGADGGALGATRGCALHPSPADPPHAC